MKRTFPFCHMISLEDLTGGQNMYGLQRTGHVVFLMGVALGVLPGEGLAPPRAASQHGHAVTLDI